MTREELNQYNALSESDKQQYKTFKSRHPNWNHKQLMTRIAFDKHLYEYDDRNVVMRGLGFDIANSENLSEAQKNELIKSVHGWLFHDRELTYRDKGLLFRVRKEYHICNSGLYDLANSLTALISSFQIND